MPSRKTTRLFPNALALCCLLALTQPVTALAQTGANTSQAVTYRIAAGPLDTALNQFSTQSKLQVVYSPELVAGKTTAGLSGQFAPQEALKRLLQGTGLGWNAVNDSMYVLKPVSASPKPPAVKPRRDKARTSDDKDKDVVTMPAIMVQGTRTLNMDITRTRDDPQPYVVFDREQIESSGATSLEQFLQQRLTMNTRPVNNGSRLSTSQITLRGLSSAQTLILIDGHRASSPGISSGASGSGSGALSQTDITGIPLASIERIEVLPTTASGIYGGSATGGVINIILRRDYTGAEVRFSYDSAFSTDTATRKLDLTFGRGFNEGRTNLLVTANYSDANDLLIGDRDLVERGRDAIWNNNPSWFLPPAGLPPMGAMTNIASSDGSNLVLKDGTPLNASFTSVPEGYAGSGSDGGAALAANAGIYNWALANNALEDTRGNGRKQALYSQPEVKTGSLVLRHEFSDSLQVFADLSSSYAVNRFQTEGFTSSYLIPAEAPTNPFAQAIWVSAPLSGIDSEEKTTIEHDRVMVGFVKKLPRDWQMGADYTWDSTITTNNEAPFSASFPAAVTTGAVDVLRDLNLFPVDISPYYADQLNRYSPIESTMKDANMRLSGPVANLSGGPLTLSASLAHRDERIADYFFLIPSFGFGAYNPDRSQSVTSAYGEIRVPLFSDKNAQPGLRELEVQIAVRRDDYVSRSGDSVTFFGSEPSPLPEVVRARNAFVSVDPTVALRWKPWQSLALRASYGTGFLPPPLNLLVSRVNALPVVLGTDPLRGNTLAGPYSLIIGGNQDLEPEQSRSWSAGFVFNPSTLPDLRLSVDYTRIEKSDNIGVHPGGIQGLINDGAVFPGRVVRGPNLPGDPPDWAGPITLVDFSAMNLAKADLAAWDVQLDFKEETELYGVFDWFFIGTWQPHYRVQAISAQPTVDNAGVSALNPLEFKASAGFTWTGRAMRVGWNVTHFDSYRVSSDPVAVANQGGDGKVPSQTYHDVFLNYDFSLSHREALRWLSGFEVQLGVRNLFNRKPPLDAASSNFYSPFGDPRLAAYYITLTSRF